MTDDLDQIAEEIGEVEVDEDELEDADVEKGEQFGYRK
jgi:hypothetical protein